jgi:hypothetical protein
MVRSEIGNRGGAGGRRGKRKSELDIGKLASSRLPEKISIWVLTPGQKCPSLADRLRGGGALNAKTREDN